MVLGRSVAHRAGVWGRLPRGTFPTRWPTRARANVILGPGGPKVIDFGIAHAADTTSITQTGSYVGSLAWMSPEQITGAELTSAADVFAWGLLVAFAALGRHPYGEGRPEAVAFRIINQQPDLAGLAPNLRRALLAALTADPLRRATPQQLRTLLVTDQDAADLTQVISQGWDATAVDLPTGLNRAAVPHNQPRVSGEAPAPRRWPGGIPALAVGAAIALGAAAGAGALTLHQITSTGTQGHTGDPAGAPGPVPSPEPDLVNHLYPVSWDDGVTVHSDTRMASDAIQWLPHETVVHVVCRTRGEVAVTKTGMTTTWWDRIDSPVPGYISDARINTGGYPPDVPLCQA
jgi:hypothetical protein